MSLTETALQQSNVERPMSKSKAKKFKAAEYLREMNILDKLANHQVIKNMNKRINYLKNPRFAVNRAPIRFEDINQRPDLQTKIGEQDFPFRPQPRVILYQEYIINQVYEIKLYLTNIDKISRRFKYLPPAKQQFTVSEVVLPQKYDENDLEPNREYGLIAPGMNVILNVKFQATSFAEFEDEITIFGDENFIKIPILARREPPSINLPEILDCQSCWLGDRADMVYRVTNKGGEAGFKFFRENETENDAQEDGEMDVLRLQNFTIYPTEFFIQKNETQEIFLQYYPSIEGSQNEKIVLACDNQTSATQSQYTIQGKGNMAELQVYGIDDYVIDPTQEKESSDGLKKLFFPNTFPKQQVQKKIRIKNQTTVKVKYHWSLFKNDRDTKKFHVENPDTFCFKIEPCEGYFNPDDVVTFTIFFKSENCIPIFEYANLFIDDIPFQAIRNPPETLKKQLEEKNQQVDDKIENQLNQPGYLGSNSTRPSFNYYEFELIGQSSYGKVEITPEFYAFPQKLYINQRYSKKYIIKNVSNCEINYVFRDQKLSSDNFKVFMNETTGNLGPNLSKTIEIGIQSSKIGNNQKAEFQIDFDFADSLQFLIVGDFIGPSIRIHEPNINLGLLKSFSQAETYITIENISDIPAQCLFKFPHQQNNNLDFHSLIQLVQQQDQEQRKQIQEDDQEVDIFDDAIKPPKFLIEPPFFELQPHEKLKVKLLCYSYNPKSHHSIIEIQVDNSDSHFLHLLAEIQDVHLALNTCNLSVPNLLINQKYVFEKDKSESWVELQNLGNIPSQFKWDIQSTEQYEIKFEPEEGVVGSKQDLPIKISILPRIQGDLYILFACDCFGLNYPLGFELKSQVLGLKMEYEIVEAFVEEQKKLSALNITRMPGQKISSSFLQKTLGNQRTLGNQQNSKAVKAFKNLETLEFYNCTINQHKDQFIILRNISGIPTQYSIYVEKYQPYEVDLSEAPQENPLHQSMKSNNFSQTGVSNYNKSKKLVTSVRPTNLLTQNLEQKNNFTSVQGKEAIQKKILEKDARYYLQNKQGLAIFCDQKYGDLPPHTEIMIQITLFNEICGFFSDNLCIDIKGLELQKFPINIDIQGTPVVVCPNQLGIDYKGDYPSFHLGQYMTNSALVTREFKIQNNGPKDVEIEWKIFNMDQTISQQNYFNIKVIPPLLGSGLIAQIEYQPIEPPQAKDGPFQVNTGKEIIKGRKEKFFKVTFESKNERNFQSVIIAQPVLIENPEIKLGKLAMYLRALTVKPYLYLDKLPINDQSQIQKLRFQKWALAPTNKEEKNFALVNNKNANVLCNIALEGPFKLKQSSTNSPMKYSLTQTTLSPKEQILTSFNLVPSSCMELCIKFDGPAPKNQEKWPNQQEFIMEGYLNIAYSNGDFQRICLEAHLLRPYVSLNTSGHSGIQGENNLDFQIVHIYNKKTISIYVSNDTKVPAKWKLTNIKTVKKKGQTENVQREIDDSSVFEFAVTEGVIQGPSIPVKSLPNTSALPTLMTHEANQREKLIPQQILINFRPQKNVTYQSKFKIVVEEGNFVEFTLRGTGTYDEHLEKKI